MTGSSQKALRTALGQGVLLGSRDSTGMGSPDHGPSLCSSHGQFSSVAQSCLTLCDPVTAACQASLSITNSRSLLKLVSMEPVMPSNHLILSHLILISYFHGNQAKNTLQAASAAGLSHKKGARAKDIL